MEFFQKGKGLSSLIAQYNAKPLGVVKKSKKRKTQLGAGRKKKRKSINTKKKMEHLYALRNAMKL